jgi:hypothetical protein
MNKKLKVFDFEYNCIIQKNGESVDIVGYNSPYNANQDAQSKDDIETAIKEYKIVDLSKLEEGKRYNLKFTCRFIENKDKTFNQLFIFKELKWQQ